MSKGKPVYVCRCEEVRDTEIENAIRDGARTVKGVKIRTKATMGLCQGRTCCRLIEKMLAQVEDIDNLSPGKKPPVRAIKISEVIEKGDDND